MNFLDEEDTNVNDPKTWKQQKIRITTTIHPKAWNLCKEHDISFNDALEFGAVFLMAEKFEDQSYPPCDLFDKLKRTIKLLEEKSQLYKDLKENKDKDGN